MKQLLSLKILWVVLIIALTIPSLLPLFKPGFFPTQDYIYVARLYQMDKALSDGHFPVRWANDFRYGEPLFNFYAPLPYYAGAIIKKISGLDYLQTIKVLFGLGFLLSALAMFWLASGLAGRAGGLLAAMLYLYAPYHSVDVYVRGALSESWALIFFPLIFLFLQRVANQASLLNISLLAASLGGLFLTHNIMTVLFAPFAAGWAVYLLIVKDRSIKIIIPKTTSLAVALVWGFALAASFLVPAFVERSYIQTSHLTDGYFDFRGHFVAIPQFFSNFWGYGASLWGPVDDMSFQVGIIHWAILTVVLLTTILWFRKKYGLLVLALMMAFLFSLFMQHNQSSPIWERFSLLAFVQFPWRFLGISIFIISLLGALAPLSVKNFKFQWIATALLIALIIGWNIQFFHPDSYYLDSTDAHYMGSEVLSKDDKLPKDYLPVWVKRIDLEILTTPRAVEGLAEVTNYYQKTGFASFDVSATESALLELPLTHYPGWQVKVDQKSVSLAEPSVRGQIRVEIVPGQHLVQVLFTETPLRQIVNLVSLIAWLILIGFWIRVWRQNRA